MLERGGVAGPGFEEVGEEGGRDGRGERDEGEGELGCERERGDEVVGYAGVRGRTDADAYKEEAVVSGMQLMVWYGTEAQ